MNIKLTPWEKRNLNVESSVEFYIGHDERWNDIYAELLSHDEQYQVMHIASGNTDVLMNAPREGFLPVEMNIQLSRKLSEIQLPRIYTRFAPHISCNISTEDERKYLLDTISEGTIFSTDKVALDPIFGVEFAGRRYSLWTQDVLNQGAELLSMKYKEKIAAFDVLIDKGNGVCEAFLGGTLPEFRNSGLGFLAIYFITKYASEKGFKRIITGVSSNNIPILKLHEMFGYGVDSVSYCLIKHC